MNALLEHFVLPLLARDFRTQAERRSTYWLRALCSLSLYFCALMFGLYANQYANISVFWYLGKGKDILTSVFVTETIGAYLLIPAWLCGAIAGEKEKQTLMLLLGTRLGPWRILMEKYLAVMLRIAILLAISLPILAVAYPLGGITPTDIFRSVWSLALTALSVGSVTLFCSSLCATTASAYLTTYAILFLQFFGPTVIGYYLAWNVTGYLLEAFFPAIGISVLYPSSLGLHNFYGLLNGSIFSIATVLLYYSIPSLIQILFFLFLARWVFVSRALKPADSLVKRIRSLFASGPILVRLLKRPPTPRHTSHADFPEYNPIVWRENRSSPFGLAIWIGVTALGLLIKSSYLAEDKTMREFEFVLWSLTEYFAALLWIIALGTGIFQQEQTRQTLDVLISTPLQTRDLIEQKLQRAWRVGAWIFGYFALSTLLNLLAWLDYYHLPGRNPGPITDEFRRTVYSLNFMGLALVYAPLVFWLAFGVGLQARSQGRALVVTTIAIIAWAIVPLLLMIAFLNLIGVLGAGSGNFGFLELTASAASFASPLVLHASSMNLLYQHWAYTLFTLIPAVYVFHVIVLFILRWLCLRLAVLKLGRLDRHDPFFNPWAIERIPQRSSKSVETAP